VMDTVVNVGGVKNVNGHLGDYNGS